MPPFKWLSINMHENLTFNTYTNNGENAELTMAFLKLLGLQIPLKDYGICFDLLKQDDVAKQLNIIEELVKHNIPSHRF